MTRRALAVYVLIFITGVASVAISFAASPVVRCPRYREIPPRNQSSDLRGGAITQWLPTGCHR